MTSDPAPIRDRPVEGPSSPKSARRILVADDHPVVREGVRAILERQGFQVVAEAANGQEAVGRSLEVRPDVAVLDLSMPVKNGIEAAREILRDVPETRIILLTVHRSDYYVRQALQTGVHGYVLKNRSSDDLVQAICEVCQGMIYLSADISPEILREYRRTTDLPPTRSPSKITGS
jgi:DNA-binding NarL/FixJ family response regulator